MRVLKAKLHQLDKERKKELKRNLTLGLGENSWGNQIRSEAY
jgi:protein subunit release factor B